MRHRLTLWARLNRREMELDAADQELAEGLTRFQADDSDGVRQVRRLLTRVDALRQVLAGEKNPVVSPRCWFPWGPLYLADTLGKEAAR